MRGWRENIRPHGSLWKPGQSLAITLSSLKCSSVSSFQPKGLPHLKRRMERMGGKDKREKKEGKRRGRLRKAGKGRKKFIQHSSEEHPFCLTRAHYVHQMKWKYKFGSLWGPFFRSVKNIRRRHWYSMYLCLEMFRLKWKHNAALKERGMNLKDQTDNEREVPLK